MSRTIAMLLVAAGLLAACSGPAPGRPEARCDDGGDGGVVIDGVCL